jgi:hypothetical protein
MYGRDDAYKIFRKFEGKRPLGRPRHSYEYNIKMDLKYGVRTWAEFIWHRLQSRGRLL